MNCYTFARSSNAAAASAAAAPPSVPCPSTRGGGRSSGVCRRGNLRLRLPETLPNDIPLRRTTNSCFEGYRVLESVGSGTYANVWRVVRATPSKVSSDDSAFSRETVAQTSPGAHGKAGEFLSLGNAEKPEVFAAKLLQPQKFPKETLPRVLDMFAKEIVNLATCQCPGVVRVEEVVEGSEGWLIVQEYVDGGTVWCEQVCKDEDDAFLHFIQLVQAVLFLQEKKVMHRDLKPTNILRCRKDKRVVLADFGWSERVEQCQLTPMEWPGTLEINPPEVISSTGPLTERIDNYAIGMALLLFLSGRFICRQKGLDAATAAPYVLRTVQQLRASRPPSVFRGPADAWILFLGLTAPHPSRRWSLNRVLSHSWVQQKLLQLAPRARLWHPRVCHLATHLTRVFEDPLACSSPRLGSPAEQEGRASTGGTSAENSFACENACSRSSQGLLPSRGDIEAGNKVMRATKCELCSLCGMPGCTGQPCTTFSTQGRVVSRDHHNRQSSLGAESHHTAAGRPSISVCSTADSFVPTPQQIAFRPEGERNASCPRGRVSAPTSQAFHTFLRCVPAAQPRLAETQHASGGGGSPPTGQRSVHQTGFENVSASQVGAPVPNCFHPTKGGLQYSVSYVGPPAHFRATDCEAKGRSTQPVEAWELFEQKRHLEEQLDALQHQKRQLERFHQRQQLNAPQCNPPFKAFARSVHQCVQQTEPQANPSPAYGWEAKFCAERHVLPLGEKGQCPGSPPQLRQIPSSTSDGGLAQSPFAASETASPPTWHQKMPLKLQYRRGGSYEQTPQPLDPSTQPSQSVSDTQTDPQEWHDGQALVRDVAAMKHPQGLCRRVTVTGNEGPEARRDGRIALNAHDAGGVIIGRGYRPRPEARSAATDEPAMTSRPPLHPECGSSEFSPPSHATTKAFARVSVAAHTVAGPPPTLRGSSVSPRRSKSQLGQGGPLRQQVDPNHAYDASVRGESSRTSSQEGRLVRTAAQRCLPSRLSFESPLADEAVTLKRSNAPVDAFMSSTACASGQDTESRGAAASPQGTAGCETPPGVLEREPQHGRASADSGGSKGESGTDPRTKPFVPPLFFGENALLLQSQRMPHQMTVYGTPRILFRGTPGETGWRRTGETGHFARAGARFPLDPGRSGRSPKLSRSLCGAQMSRDSAGSDGAIEGGSAPWRRLLGHAAAELKCAVEVSSEATGGKDCILEATLAKHCSQGTTYGHFHRVRGSTGPSVEHENDGESAGVRPDSFTAGTPRGTCTGEMRRALGEAETGKALSPEVPGGYMRAGGDYRGGEVGVDAEAVARPDPLQRLRGSEHELRNGSAGAERKDEGIPPREHSGSCEATSRGGSEPDVAQAVATINRDSQGTMAIAGTLTFGGSSLRNRRSGSGDNPSPTGVQNGSEAAQRKVPGYGETTTTSVLRLVHRPSLPVYTEGLHPDGWSPQGSRCAGLLSCEGDNGGNKTSGQDEPWIACLMRNYRWPVQRDMPPATAAETPEGFSQGRLPKGLAENPRDLNAGWISEQSSGGSGRAGLLDGCPGCPNQMLPAHVVRREVQGGDAPEPGIVKRNLQSFRNQMFQGLERRVACETQDAQEIHEQEVGESEEADTEPFLQRFVSHLLELGRDPHAVGTQSGVNPRSADRPDLARGSLASFEGREDMLVDYGGIGGAAAVKAQEIFEGDDAGPGLRGHSHDDFILSMKPSSPGGTCLRTTPTGAQELAQLIESGTASAKRCTFEGGLLGIPSCAGATTTATTTGPGVGTLPATSPGAGEEGLDSGWGFQGVEGEEELTEFRTDSPVCIPIQ
ncbi:putative protein kinase [Neospora caninum Liverpool]|uniref:Protein kinase, putative n=1 Tax=Neospora caninum (strain Liverpool) TaxID=572307 RepID=F0VJI7_NEOCL|nr:putative protein kinase [Neospora caninum Liverpool]CBZ53898.1 putative protein kinase [Neospora caninum Liverpool]CEL67894.1 TPA: protein kinase, putative [Neospora caninum Liverpool]|eukprot:XP_003883930.1 putative protein kinase [Neospora caninum Liverpool]